ncbi:DUF6069 family protein [Glycomyces terrestris]|uniref:Cell envelope biogenesis protein OmpA n=1 Tax=Glycomyces terrestris TaxID=2493553 RepID=A0A426UUU2_9ACTN|nr:DUF6069 family protein [Glycomyces terrestris]RRR98095.1 hypothetical protein EIW28_14310 [Glycomyces terrestris]
MNASRTAAPRRARRLAAAGLLAVPAAVAATVLTAALARAAGADFAIPAGGETIPLPGFAVVTGCCCLVGLALAGALLRWSARPAERFVQTALALTAVSLVPPLLSGGSGPTIAALLVLHLVPAAVMIPALAVRLRRLAGS